MQPMTRPDPARSTITRLVWTKPRAREEALDVPAGPV